MEYRGFNIEPDLTGYALFEYHFYIDAESGIDGEGNTVEDCKQQIDDLLDDC